jgi:hypothetical protein
MTLPRPFFWLCVTLVAILAIVVLVGRAEWAPPRPTTARVEPRVASDRSTWVAVSTKPAEWAMPPDELRARLTRIEATLERLRERFETGVAMLCRDAASENWVPCAPGTVAPGVIP